MIALTGRWQGCSVTKFGPIHDDGHRVSCHGRSLWDRLSSEAVEAMDEVHVCFKGLAGGFMDEVLQSHGSHVLAKVRDYGALLFWMPRILQEPHLTPSSAIWDGAKPCWSVSVGT